MFTCTLGERLEEDGGCVAVLVEFGLSTHSELDQNFGALESQSAMWYVRLSACYIESTRPNVFAWYPQFKCTRKHIYVTSNNFLNIERPASYYKVYSKFMVDKTTLSKFIWRYIIFNIPVPVTVPVTYPTYQTAWSSRIMESEIRPPAICNFVYNFKSR